MAIVVNDYNSPRSSLSMAILVSTLSSLYGVGLYLGMDMTVETNMGSVVAKAIIAVSCSGWWM